MDVFAHTNVFLPCAPIARLFVICASVIYSFLLLMYATSVATEPLYCLNESRSFVSRVARHGIVECSAEFCPLNPLNESDSGIHCRFGEVGNERAPVGEPLLDVETVYNARKLLAEILPLHRGQNGICKRERTRYERVQRCRDACNHPRNVEAVDNIADFLTHVCPLNGLHEAGDCVENALDACVDGGNEAAPVDGVKPALHTCSNRRAHLLPVDGRDKALDGVNQRVPFVGERRADGRPVGVFKDAVQPRSQPCAQCSPVKRAEEGVERTEHKVQAIRNQLTEVCPVEAGHEAVQDKGNSVCPFYGKRLYCHNPVINCGHDAVQTASDDFADALPVTRFKGSSEFAAGSEITSNPAAVCS